MKRALILAVACVFLWTSVGLADFMPSVPAPGSRVARVPLAPEVAQLRDAGLAAAQREDWSAAIAAFKDAQERAHCAPALMYNLGLAHAKAGNLVSAALWYRAYLAAEPDAPNADTLREEISRFAIETEARSKRAFEEAERLANQLSTSPPQPGGTSLRQKALEDIALHAFNAGDIERGDRLLQMIRVLPGAGPIADWEYMDRLRSRPGLFPAVFARDLEGAKTILAEPGVSLVPHVKAGYMARLYVEHADASQARAWIDPLDYESTNRLPNFYYLEDSLQSLGGPEALGVLATIHRRLLKGARNFNASYFGYAARAVEAAFVDGEETIALDFARDARAYYERFDADGENAMEGGRHYILILAVLGDAKAIKRYFHLEYFPLPFQYSEALFSRIALVAARTMSPADAIKTIDLLADEWNVFKNPKPPLESMIKQFPAAYFARSIAEGREDLALNALAAGQQSPEPRSFRLRDEYRRALGFAVATGRSSLAYALARQASQETGPAQIELKTAERELKRATNLVEANVMSRSEYDVARDRYDQAKAKLESVNLAVKEAMEFTRSDVILRYLYRLRALAKEKREVERQISRVETEVCQGWRPRDAAQAREVRWRIDHARSIDPKEYQPLPATWETTARDTPEILPSLLASHAVVLTFGVVAARSRSEAKP